MRGDRIRALKRRLGAARQVLKDAASGAEPALEGTDITGARGFTLLELLVALAIGGIVVLLAHRLFTGVADGAARTADARTALDREHNARRLVTELIGSLDIGRPGTAGFGGEPARVSFSTWALGVGGWPERRRVEFGRGGDAFVLTGVADVPIPLVDSVGAVEFDYLLDYGADAAWVRTWKSPVSAPLAIRIRVTGGRGRGDRGRVDTLLLIVGPRG